MTMTATTRWASASLLCSMNINAYPRKGPCEKWPGNKCWAGFFALHTKIVWDLPCMGKTGALSEQREIGILETTLCATSHLTHFLTCRHLSFFRHRTAENASFLSPHRRERGEARHWDSPPHRFPATRTTIRPIFSRYFRFHSSNPSQWNDLPPTPNDLPAEWRRKTGHIIPSMRDAVRIRHPKPSMRYPTQNAVGFHRFSETRPSTGGGARGTGPAQASTTHAPFHWPRIPTFRLPLLHCSSIDPFRYQPCPCHLWLVKV